MPMRITGCVSRQIGQTGPVLTFRLFNIPVDVRPSFLIVAAIIGIRPGNDVSEMLAWVGLVFVSILIHELGHALTARAFGSTVKIELNGIGGLTSWTVPPEEFGPGRRALVAAAGSALGVFFGGIVWVIAYFTGPFTGMTEFVVRNLIFVNVFWGLLNWLPIRPLDGGHLLQSLLQKVAPERGERIANIIFFVTAAAALAFSLWARLLLITLLAGWLLVGELSRGRARIRPVRQVQMSFDDPPSEVESEVEPDQSDG